jgi:long-chain acyl-CoA synthetase
MTRIPQRTLGEGLRNSVSAEPLKTAIIANGVEYSYKYLEEKSEILARHLLSTGLVKGDRVAIFLNNSIHSAISVYGITLAGGVFILINPQTKEDKLKYILRDSGTKIAISENLLKDILSSALDGVDSMQEVIMSDIGSHLFPNMPVRKTSFEELFARTITNDGFPEIIPLDLAALIYTSGSTGFPKGVMMTHQSMVFATWSLLQYQRLSNNDRIMLVLPLAFDYGLYQLLMAITIGGSIVIEESFVFPGTIYKEIGKWKPTVFPGVPTVFSTMIESYNKSGIVFHNIEKITNTAAALLPEMIPKLKLIFPNALIFKMYGLTECKRVCYLEPELIDLKSASVGKAIPGTEVFLLDSDGNLVPPGGQGILHIRGPHVMAGYWNNAELTDEMLKPGKIPGERILCSHDLFRTDEEGFLYFLGRTDDIIKTRAEKVSPSEVENALLKDKGVREAAVIGIPHKTLGEAIIAFVTPYENMSVDERSIRQVCVRNLELFMVPERIIILDKLPKSANGKIDKKGLKEKLLRDEF